ACRTVIGFGAPKKAGSSAAHGSPLGPEEVAAAREKLGWHHPPFEIPEEIYEVWRGAAKRGIAARPAWEGRVQALDPARRAEFERRLGGALPETVGAALRELERRLLDERPGWATRKAGNEVLKVLTAALPELVGGSADLAGSNLTNTPSTPPLGP